MSETTMPPSPTTSEGLAELRTARHVGDTLRVPKVHPGDDELATIELPTAQAGATRSDADPLAPARAAVLGPALGALMWLMLALGLVLAF